MCQRVGGIQGQTLPERLLGPIPLPIAAKLRERHLDERRSQQRIDGPRAVGRTSGDGKRQVRLDQRVEAEEVVGTGERHVRACKLRVALDRVLEVLDRRTPAALKARLPEMLAALERMVRVRFRRIAPRGRT